MVMWTNTHCLHFFLHVILYILSQYVHNYRPSTSPSILINLFKVATYLSCGKDY